MEALDTHRLVEAEIETPDLVAARRLFAGIAKQAISDALRGSLEAEQWLDETVPNWRPPLGIAEKRKLRLNRRRREEGHTRRLAQMATVQSWLRQNDTYRLVIEYSPKYQRFYAEVHRPCPDNPDDWIAQAVAKNECLVDALANLGERLEKESQWIDNRQ